MKFSFGVYAVQNAVNKFESHTSDIVTFKVFQNWSDKLSSCRNIQLTEEEFDLLAEWL